MGKQIDYPADTVGTDGTVYPSVGENIRHLWDGAKIVTIKAKYDGTKFTSVECPLKYTIKERQIIITCKELVLLSIHPLYHSISFAKFYVFNSVTTNNIGVESSVTDINEFIMRVIVNE